jgi:hypothetical protein
VEIYIHQRSTDNKRIYEGEKDGTLTAGDLRKRVPDEN